MKAIQFQKHAQNHDDGMFVDVDIPSPSPGPHDLLVRIEAVSINPVDTKVRSGHVRVPDAVDIMGWDAAGTVVATGDAVRLFKPGDDVFYAGTFTRNGANAELNLVDEQMVGIKPSSLSFAEAAALPLTGLTAWQLLFDRLEAPVSKRADTGTLLIIGGAGGVGSILIQLARRLTGLMVIATASRPQSRDWCLEMGAHHVIDHSKPLPPQILDLSIPPVRYIASLTHTEKHMPEIVEIIAPHGKVGVIDDHDYLDVAPLKAKSVSLHWEMVFTRPLFDTPDLIGQHRILNEIASLVDSGVLRTTMTRHLTPLSAESISMGHRLVESGAGTGKVVVSHISEALG